MADNKIPDDSINTSIADYIETMSLDAEGTLKSIDLTLKAIAKQDGLVLSQSSLRDLIKLEGQAQSRSSARSRQGTYRDPYGRTGTPTQGGTTSYQAYFDGWTNNKNNKARAGKMFDKITDDFEDTFTKALYGSAHPFQDALSKSIVGFANSLGTDVNNLGKELGKRFGQMAKDSPLVRQWTKETEGIQKAASSVINSSLSKVSTMLGGTGNLDLTQILKEDRSEEVPQVKDIDEIYSRNTHEIIDKMNEILEAVGYDVKGVQASAGASTNEEDIEEIYNMGQISDLIPDSIKEKIGKIGDKVPDAIKDKISGIKEKGANFIGENQTFGELGQTLTKVGESANAFPAVGAAAEGLGAELTALGPELAALPIPYLHIALLGATILLDKLSEAIQPAVEGFKSFGKSVSNAAKRDINSATKYNELRKERIKADTESIRKAAFTLIEDAANKVESVWDNILTTVSATQQLDKAGVQDLWSNYAQRLTENNLASVVSSADIMEKLESVLKQGLTGAVAEEFAYQATILNSAVPTEDFFQYASTYASLAANAIKQGASQQEALELANSELAAFADNVLYASRELAGGFTTSLTNASSLFESSAKIAMASRTGDVSNISGVLTSVSAVVGSIAPDLANSLVDSVVQAAIGGNSSELTALRSLAGVGASNSAFLQAFASNPQQIFETLFNNLARLQAWDSANYMEVAEALSSVFNISMDAFSRVDFQYLADAIHGMQLNSGELQENLEALASGQTTATSAQLRMQKINEVMVEEGLAYVLDNEVARSIQEHMWQEQIAREMQEASYAVELQGGALDLLTGIQNTIKAISNIINPISWAKQIGQIAFTAIEAAQNDIELSALVNAGKVGTSTSNMTKKAFTDLTTTGKDLKLTQKYYKTYTDLLKSSIASSGLQVSALTGKALTTNSNQYYTKSVRSMVSKSTASMLTSGNWKENATNLLWMSDQQLAQAAQEELETQDDAQQRQKEYIQSLATYINKGNALSDQLNNLRKTVSTSSKVIKNAINGSVVDAKQLKISKADLMDKYIESDLKALKSSKGTGLQHREFFTQAELEAQVLAHSATMEKEGLQTSFEGWVKEITGQTNWEKASTELQKTLDLYGQTVEDLRAIYDQQESAKASAQSKARELHEVQFWEDMQQFATKDFPWYMREWERYYIQHEAYTTATADAYSDAMKQAELEKSGTGDAVLKLAEALIQNDNWLGENLNALKDPQVQTNALLAKILLVAEAIMQQNNETSIVSVPNALTALSLGISAPGGTPTSTSANVPNKTVNVNGSHAGGGGGNTPHAALS